MTTAVAPAPVESLIETSRFEPRHKFQNRQRSKDQQFYSPYLYVYAVDVQTKSIYFGVDAKILGEADKKFEVAEQLDILRASESENYYIEACNHNLKLVEPGLNNRTILFVNENGQRINSADASSNPLMCVAFISGS